MKTKKETEFKITIGLNVYGGNWAEIEVSKEIKTKVAVFRLTGEGQVLEFLKSLNLELFQGEPFNFDPRLKKEHE